MIKPKAIVLKADGINRDEDMAFAFELAGAQSKIVHVNDLRSKKEKLSNYQILGIPGGFAYGEEIVSVLSDELKKFVEKKETAVIGVCNGFQVLVRTGLVPFRNIGGMDATLINNDSGHFECRWIKLKVEENCKSKFLTGMENEVIWYPVAHGEGKFFAKDTVLNKIEKENLVAFRYVDEKGNPTEKYPDNPNGAINAIAGITDESGRVLGLMPHPECFVRIEQHPNWRRGEIKKPQGLPLFKNMVNFAKLA